MQRFFQSIADIHQHTLSLRWNQNQLRCEHCHQHDQWVSHGFIYKQLSIDKLEPVGKRILCSNRFGRTGCGRTHQFYCDDRVPFLHYSVSVCIAFVLALLFDPSYCVPAAYRHATGARDCRNAWRWLTKLWANLAAFRTFLIALPFNATRIADSTHTPLMSTLSDLLTRFNRHTGSLFQFNTQTPFL